MDDDTENAQGVHEAYTGRKSPFLVGRGSSMLIRPQIASGNSATCFRCGGDLEGVTVTAAVVRSACEPWTGVDAPLLVSDSLYRGQVWRLRMYEVEGFQEGILDDEAVMPHCAGTASWTQSEARYRVQNRRVSLCD